MKLSSSKKEINGANLEQFIKELDTSLGNIPRLAGCRPSLVEVNENQRIIFASADIGNNETKAYQIGEIYGTIGKPNKYTAVHLNYEGEQPIILETQLLDVLTKLTSKYS
jgi:hypothetical protein